MAMRDILFASAPRSYLSDGARLLLLHLGLDSGQDGWTLSLEGAKTRYSIQGADSALAELVDAELLEVGASGLLRLTTPPEAEAIEIGYRKRPIPKLLRAQVFARDGWKCLRCGSDTALRADHVVPESKGGPATLGNLQTLCATCNSVKGTRTIDFRGATA